MNFKRIRNFLLFLIIFTTVFTYFTFSQLDEETIKKAHRVLGLIDFLERNRLGSSSSRNLTVTEGEFNAYLAYLIWEEKEEFMKSLQLKFFESNIIEGKVFFDLKGLNIPSSLKPEMTLLFSGRLKIKEGQGKFELSTLYLENRPIQTKLFDAVFYFISKVQGIEFSGLNRWYELPHGIKNIKLARGKAVIYY